MNQGTQAPDSTTALRTALAWTPEHPVKVRHALGGSLYCVPAALSALTGLTTLETTNLLKSQGLGDVAIRGVFYPFALKTLKALGYQCQEWGFLEPGGLYLLVLPGHVGVFWNSQFFDNSNPTGTDKGVPGKRRIQKIFRIWKEEANQ